MDIYSEEDEGRKGSTCFLITFNHITWDKDAFPIYLLADDLISAAAVCQEKYHPPLDCLTGLPQVGDFGFHHHCFIRFKENVKLSRVRFYVDSFLGGEPLSVDIQVRRCLIL
jgi:hypothetical protein